MAFQDTPVLLLLLVATCSGGPWIAPHISGDMIIASHNVSCQVNGIFSIPESCHDYYQCDDWDGPDMQIYEFTCPDGSVFDDYLDICNIPEMVTTRPHCVSETQSRSKRSVFQEEQFQETQFQKEENCTQYDVEVAAESARDSCKLIYYVDKYVTVVRSMISVNVPDYVDREDYVSTVNQYNVALKNAQNHTYIWRNGDDIMSGIKRTYNLAKLFGPEFQRKFKILQNRMKALRDSATNPERILELELDIERMKEENSNITAMLSDVPKNLKVFFVNSIKRNLQLIADKTKELNGMNFSVLGELKEMIRFMEFVKTDAGRIEAKANATRGKIKVFKDHVGIDRNAFRNSLGLAQQSLVSLEAERNATELQIMQLKDKVAETEKERIEEKAKADETKAKMLKELDEVKQMMTDNNLRAQSADDKYHTGSKWLLLPVVGWIIGGFQMSQASSELKRLANEKAYRLLFLESQIKVFETQLSMKDNELTRLHQTIQQQDDQIQTKREAIDKLSFVDFYLENVITDAQAILPHIQRALQSLLRLEEIFDNIVYKLEALISRAKTVEGEAESRNIHYFIYHELSDMQNNWNESYADITSLGKCTNDEFLQMLFASPIPTVPTTELPVNSTESVQSINDIIVESFINDTTDESPINSTMNPSVVLLSADNNYLDIADYNPDDYSY